MNQANATHPHLTLQVDLSALQANFLTVRAAAEKQVPPVFCTGARPARPICVLKADAYGHGARECATALSAVGCDFFAVATACEALSLRAALKTADILILTPIDPADAPLLAEAGITVTLGCAEDIDRLRTAMQHARKRGEIGEKTRLFCHAKLDTGMHRLGLPCAGEEDCKKAAAQLTPLSDGRDMVLTGLFTHPASADERGSRQTGEQLRAFCRLRRLMGGRYFYHFSNSAAALSLGTLGFDGYRIGLALYGIPPIETKKAPPLLRPVARVETALTRVFSLAAGERLGYGGGYTAPRAMRVGVAAVGYADGLARAAEGACLFLHRRPVRIIGRVCMDQCMLALGENPAKVGDRVTVFSDATELLALARHTNTVPYEWLCHLPNRAKRTYLG